MMTIFGCVIAGILYFFIKDSHSLQIVILIVSIFFLIHELTASYLLAMFYLGFFLVFLIGLISEWSNTLLIYRITETAVGCLIAFVVARLVFPHSAREHVSHDMPKLFSKLKNTFTASFENFNKLHEFQISNDKHITLSPSMDLISRENARIKYL